MGMKREFINQYASDWEVGADGVLICPCGHRVEDDGTCPNGHKSPLLKHGLI